MAHWENWSGDEFENKEIAYNDAVETMTDSDFREHMSYYLSYSELLEWATQQDGFWDTFENEASLARESYFNTNYHLIENDDENEDS